MSNITNNIPITTKGVKNYWMNSIENSKKVLTALGYSKSQVMALVYSKIDNPNKTIFEYHFGQVWNNRTLNPHIATLLEQIADELETKNK